MPYSLPELATRDRDFRTITPNAIDEQAYLRLLTPILQEWRDSAARSMTAYAAADISGIEEEDNHTAEKVALLLLFIRWPSFFDKVETWHRGKWLASVNYATGVDAKWMTASPGVPVGTGLGLSIGQGSGGVVQAARAATNAPSIARQPITSNGITNAVSEAVASAKSLAASLSDEARARNRQAIIGGLRRGATATEVARDVNAGLVRSRKRAVGIAENELDNAVKAFTTARMSEAGLDFAKWQHNTRPLSRARMEHYHRDGNLYRADDKIWADQLLPFCRCAKVPVLKLGKFSGI